MHSAAITYAANTHAHAVSAANHAYSNHAYSKSHMQQITFVAAMQQIYASAEQYSHTVILYF